MTISEGIALESVAEWPKELVIKLSENWITTVEQVVALSATPNGLGSLAKHLGVSEEETRRLIAVARAYLSSEDAALLEKPVEMGKYGLGALAPGEPEND